MKRKNNHVPSYDALMRYARTLGFGDIRTKIDHKTGLHALIAVHSKEMGPAIGGCRFQSYASANLALKDLLRLAFGMTLKAAASNLPHGGAKAVIIKPKGHDYKHDELMRSFGDFVEQLHGDYITSMDAGTGVDDMNKIRERTAYVIGANTDDRVIDPTPFTAIGVFRGIEAAAKFQLGADNLSGLHVAIQGGGKTAYYLCKHLHKAGAKMTVCDTQTDFLPRFREEFNANVVEPGAIYDVPCDVFSPCAIGGVINMETIKRLNTRIIAGSANNQLAHAKYCEVLQQANVLFAPDYVINAGGLIAAAMAYDHKTDAEILTAVDFIYTRLLNLFAEAHETQQPTTKIAVELARRYIQKVRRKNQLTTMSEEIA
jgi:leucine dehydrogenase